MSNEGPCPTCRRERCTWHLTGECSIGEVAPRCRVIEDMELTHVSLNKDGSFGIGGVVKSLHPTWDEQPPEPLPIDDQVVYDALVAAVGTPEEVAERIERTLHIEGLGPITFAPSKREADAFANWVKEGEAVHGRESQFLPTVVIDPTIPKGTIEIRNPKGELLGKIENVESIEFLPPKATATPKGGGGGGMGAASTELPHFSSWVNREARTILSGEDWSLAIDKKHRIVLLKENGNPIAIGSKVEWPKGVDYLVLLIEMNSGFVGDEHIGRWHVKELSTGRTVMQVERLCASRASITATVGVSR